MQAAQRYYKGHVRLTECYYSLITLEDPGIQFRGPLWRARYRAYKGSGGKAPGGRSGGIAPEAGDISGNTGLYW